MSWLTFIIGVHFFLALQPPLGHVNLYMLVIIGLTNGWQIRLLLLGVGRAVGMVVAYLMRST